MTREGEKLQLRLTSERLATLKRLCRPLEHFWDANLKSQLNFCLKTSYAPVNFLETVKNEVESEMSAQIDSWLSEGPLLPLPDLPERNPELEARCQRLRAKLEAERYSAMVDNVQPKARFSLGSPGQELRSVNRQVTMVLNMILTVAGTFVFVYKGLHIAMPSLDLGVRLILGCALSTFVFFADLYFVIQSLDLES